LYEGERIELRIRPHWRITVAPVVWAVATIAFVSGSWLVFVGDQFGSWLAGLATTAGVIVFAMCVVRPLIRWQRTDWIVTTRRVLVCHGIIRRERHDYLMSRVEDVALHQRRSDLWLGCGTLVLRPADGSSDVVLRGVPGALAVRNLVASLLRGNDL
jgi:membrane protein YdbS with pleckstrin-like domain